MVKLFLDPGHGGSDPGASNIIQESTYTLSYALELGQKLGLLGFDVNYSRSTNSSVSLAQRGAMANSWGADYFLSIHFNAGGNGSGHGIETYALTSGGQGEKLGKIVQNSLIDTTGTTNRGLKFANFQVLRDTNMPAILIEGGFVDNVSDAAKIPTDDYKHKYVIAVSKALCAFTGIAWRDVYAPVVVTPPVAIQVVVPAPIVLAPVIISPVIIGKTIAVDDVWLTVRCREHLVKQTIVDIEKLGFSAQRLELA